MEVPAERLAEIRDAPGWIWLDVTEFTDAEVWEIGRDFGFDPLAVEDVLDWSKFPKVEEHTGYTFVVGHGLSAAGDDRLGTVEYDVFVATRSWSPFTARISPGFVWGREHAVRGGSLAGASSRSALGRASPRWAPPGTAPRRGTRRADRRP